MKSIELEKTILLVLLVFTKGSVDKCLTEDLIVSKFTKRQRSLVRKSLKRLKDEGLLIKKPKEMSYRFTDKGLKRASTILSEGAKLWKVR